MNIGIFRLNTFNKIVIVFSVMSLIIGIFLALPLTALADNSGCSLQVVSGVVEVREAGYNAWKAVTNTVFLKAGDSVRTAKDASALIIFLDGSSMELGPDTSIAVKKAEGMTDNNAAMTEMTQFWGKTWNRVIKMIDPRSQYDVETPSCLASVRGTYFIVEVDKSGKTMVQTIEGIVAVQAQNKEIIVLPGYSVSVDKGSAPPILTPLQNQSPKDDTTGSAGDVKLVGTTAENKITNKGFDAGAGENNYMVLVIVISVAIAVAIAVTIKILAR
jgi:hypothetical protein